MLLTRTATFAAFLAEIGALTFARFWAAMRAETGALTLGFSVVDAVELATIAFFVVFRLLNRDFF